MNTKNDIIYKMVLINDFIELIHVFFNLGNKNIKQSQNRSLIYYLFIVWFIHYINQNLILLILKNNNCI